MFMIKAASALAGLAALASPASGLSFEYGAVSIKSTIQVDEGDVKTAHVGELVSGAFALTWEESEAPVELADGKIYMRFFANGALIKADTYDVIPNVTAFLPGSVSSPSFVVVESGSVSAELQISFLADFSEVAASSEASVSTFQRGWSMMPLFVVLFIAVVTQKVEIALMLGIFFGAFLVVGNNVSSAFKTTLDTYLVNSASDSGHVFVILFTLFLSGLVGMMDHSGGVKGLTQTLTKYATTSRAAQAITFICGFLIFFDDYTNALVVGTSLRPVTDLVSVSREKLAFLVDATSAPIAATVPISSWVGFETGEIQDQIDRIIAANNGVLPDGIEPTGFAVYVKSIPWRLYPILMVVFQIVQIATGREFGPMLIAERKVRAYRRTDGGDSAMLHAKMLSSSNEPLKNTPPHICNMLFPVGLLVFLILWILFQSGIDASDVEDPSIQEILKGADSYVALLYGTMGASLLTIIFYALQFKSDGRITLPNPKGYFKSAPKVGVDEDFEPQEGVPLMRPFESVDAWLRGIIVIFPAIVVLVLAWAVAAAMTDIGADRFFSAIVLESNVAGELPTITFLLSLFMALCTGTSWGTMGIMYPLTLVTAWRVSEAENDTQIFYAVVGSILSGAVAGDHCSPISDTTVLSSIATQCDLTAHVYTQLPYTLLVVFWAVLTGYLPGGLGAYPAGVAVLIGAIGVILSIFVIGVPVMHPTGRFDPLTELYIKFRNPQLKEDIIAATNDDVIKGEALVADEA